MAEIEKCRHWFHRRRGWWHIPRDKRWECEFCGEVTRHYDNIDRAVGRPIHRYMSVAYRGVNASG